MTAIEAPFSHRDFIRARVGALIFIVSEIMLFGGLLSSFIVYRSSQLIWPPADLPFYPIAITAINSIFLIASGITNFLYRKNHNIRLGIVTVLLGFIFLILQGIEWIQLISRGLTLTVDPYGSFFYLVVGAHALHVLAAIAWYLFALLKYQSFPWTPAIDAANTFWFFVVAIWPVIFAIVYI